MSYLLCLLQILNVAFEYVTLRKIFEHGTARNHFGSAYMVTDFYLKMQDTKLIRKRNTLQQVNRNINLLSMEELENTPLIYCQS